MFLEVSLPGLRDVVVVDPVGAPAEGRDHPQGEDDLLDDLVHIFSLFCLNLFVL